jgi:hypothetical protein
MVTSVALRGFVGVVKALRESVPMTGHVICVLDISPRRPDALGRPLAIILVWNERQEPSDNFQSFQRLAF